jgi:hypothetical protein
MSSRSYLSNRWKSDRIRVSARFGPDGKPVTLVDSRRRGRRKKAARSEGSLRVVRFPRKLLLFERSKTMPRADAL